MTERRNPSDLGSLPESLFEADRGWWAKPTPPPPWEQWQAAIGHYKRFGDGWTGHCHGIMRG